VCLDEKSKRLLADVREPVPAGKGRPGRQDYEYERKGTADLFIVSELLRGWRHVSVTERRTKTDWARCVKELVDVHYPRAERVVVVMDNLNTHTPAALYEAFEPKVGPAPVAEAGDPPHPQARLVAQHGRDRTLGARAPMPGRAPHPRPGDACWGGGRVGGRAQRRRKLHRLALHERRRADEAQAALGRVPRSV